MFGQYVLGKAKDKHNFKDFLKIVKINIDQNHQPPFYIYFLFVKHAKIN